MSDHHNGVKYNNDCHFRELVNRSAVISQLNVLLCLSLVVVNGAELCQNLPTDQWCKLSVQTPETLSSTASAANCTM